MDRRKVLFVCTEDWFFRSHFLPLGQAAISTGNYDAAVVTTASGADEDLERLGLTVHKLDFTRSSFGLLPAIKLLKQLIMLIRRERPDIIHFIALKPMLLGGLAALFVPRAATVYHLTGLGYLAQGKTSRAALVSNISFRLIGFYLKRSKSWLIAENSDDLDFLASYGVSVDKRTSLFGGAGVDPDFFTALPSEGETVCHAAYVGRMIWSKGVDVLVEASGLVNARDVELELDMYGAPDPANPGSIQNETLHDWNQISGVKWHGPISDVREVWRNCDIAVVPTRTREGMPRAMLEAASCGRPLIVTDVPGCRHFVRDGIEGLIVAPDDTDALAGALEKLASNPALRLKMGAAARTRVLEGFTEHHIREAILKIYQTLLDVTPYSRR